MYDGIEVKRDSWRIGTGALVGTHAAGWFVGEEAG